MVTVSQTLPQVHTPSPAGTAEGSRPTPRRSRAFQPGWPLVWLLVGYPLWWVLGIAQILSLAAAVVMLLELLCRPRIVAPRGFLLWLLFLAWLLAGLIVLQVDAPGTVHGGSNTRYLTFSFRLSWYLAATVVLLYLGNMRKELSTRRVTRAFGCLFVTVVGGGLLGTIAPHLDFPSAIELLLPHRVTSIQFVHDLVHPVVAQLNVVDNVENPRASAPFPYTNGWALNFAVLLPFFLFAWFGPDSGWRRRVGPLVLALALVPVIVTVNRGLWIALGATALFVALRAAASGKPRPLGAVLAGVGLVVALVAVTPLGATVEHRLNNGYSDSSRANLSTTTVETALDASPVVGFGTTRDVQGSFSSIAGGATPSCPLCAPPSLGTQGHLWLLTFATGAGGLLLYLGFYLTMFSRGLRLKAPSVALGMSVLVAHLATMPFYDVFGIAMFSIAAGAAFIWRAQLDAGEALCARTGQPMAPEPTLGGYAALVRDNSHIMVGCALLGLLVGAYVQYSRGPVYTAQVSVMLPREATYPGSSRQATTLDTLAQMVTGAEVQDAAQRATGQSWSVDPRDVSVGAAPNTRLLRINIEDPDPVMVRARTQATAEALLRSRADELAARGRQALDELKASEAGVTRAVTTLDRQLTTAPKQARSQLEVVRAELIAELNEISSSTATVVSLPVDAGAIIAPAHVSRDDGGWNVALAGGMMLGLLFGVIGSLWRRSAGARKRWPGHVTIGHIPVLARIAAEETGGWTPSRDVAAAVARLAPSVCLAVGDDPQVRAVAAQLDAAVPRTGSPRAYSEVVVVISERTGNREIAAFRAWAEQFGVRPCGAVLLKSRGRRARL